MRRSWEWLGLNLGKHAGLVASLGLAVTIALGAGLSQIQFSTTNADYLNHNDPAAVGNREYSTLFGGDPIAILFTMRNGASVDNLLTPHNQVVMSKVDAALSRDPDVYDVISPLTALNFSSTLRKGPSVSTSVAARNDALGLWEGSQSRLQGGSAEVPPGRVPTDRKIHPFARSARKSTMDALHPP